MKPPFVLALDFAAEGGSSISGRADWLSKARRLREDLADELRREEYLGGEDGDITECPSRAECFYFRFKDADEGAAGVDALYRGAGAIQVHVDDRPEGIVCDMMVRITVVREGFWCYRRMVKFTQGPEGLPASA